MHYTKGDIAGLDLHYRTMGRTFEVLAIRDDNDEANRLIDKHDNLGVLAVVGGSVIMADVNDKGVPFQLRAQAG